MNFIAKINKKFVFKKKFPQLISDKKCIRKKNWKRNLFAK